LKPLEAFDVQKTAAPRNLAQKINLFRFKIKLFTLKRKIFSKKKF